MLPDHQCEHGNIPLAGGLDFIIFQTQIYTDLRRLDVADITQFIYFNSHDDTPHTTTEYNLPAYG